MHKHAALAVIFASLIIYGCCSTTSLQSSSCPYGTYGSTCTQVCESANLGEGCFTQCMDGVRAEGLGDATACCKETIRMSCQRICDEQAQRIPGFEAEMADCLEECNANYEAVGVPLDLCAVPL